VPILAEEGGTVRFEEIIQGKTLRLEKDVSDKDSRRTARSSCAEKKGEMLHPQIQVDRPRRQALEIHALPERPISRSRTARRSRPAR
jgi:DNA-directed RNA polymerase subunit beta'